MSAPPDAFVAACIVTYRREAELRRLLDHLATSGPELGAVVVVDNAALEPPGAGAPQRPAGASFAFACVPSANLGPGAGWKRGMEEAMRLWGRPLTHFWLLDDDVVAGGEMLSRLLVGMEKARAEVAVPLITDSAGRLWGIPEPAAPALRKEIRRAKTPVEAVERLGSEPLEFCWASGTCVLVSRLAVEKAGMPRTDFRILGEDLEYSMRLAAHARGVFLPDVTAPHLPGAPATPEDRAAATLRHRAKFRALLQNLSFLAVRSPHSRHLWRYVPANYLRFFRTEGVSLTTLAQACGALWHGALRRRPAGWRDPAR